MLLRLGKSQYRFLYPGFFSRYKALSLITEQFYTTRLDFSFTHSLFFYIC
ncbi:hypothetical protein CHISP_1371 [Chitinispirillum alkaliphilum]|nr:hypothetical protein CHISP_1371 [Chitinispirillum alkaliphilum]